MKLWNVEVSGVVVVAAASQLEAEEACVQMLHTGTDLADSIYVDFSSKLQSLDDIPEGWDEDCIPYGKENKTIKEYFE